MRDLAGTLSVIAIAAVALLTLAVGVFGLRISRTTSDFYVASRTVGPTVNAAAISGEYLSAASFLGVAGLIAARGPDMLWYPVGWTAGYLVLLLFVAAPLRRSRAYTVPDFAEFRLESSAARSTSSVLVVLIAVFYLVPQLRGAGLTVQILTGAPSWVGAGIVGVVVLVNVAAGGMRSITLVQAVQYWIKLVALVLPLAVILVLRSGGVHGAIHRIHAADWGSDWAPGGHSLYLTYSLIAATFLGTMGLPHVVVRYYTNNDGRTARRTTVVVIALLSAFYVLPPVYAGLARGYLHGSGNTDTIILGLPSAVLGGQLGDVLTAVLAAGAFAAFLSTSSGLVVSVAGVVGQDVLGRRIDAVPAFRMAAMLATVGALVLTAASSGLSVAHAVELAFAVSASTFCPLLLLGIWWRGLTGPGAIAGLVAGGGLSVAAVVAASVGATATGFLGDVLAQPALCTVPVAFVVMVGVSLATARHRPEHVARTLVRLHTPEAIQVDRGGFRARGSME
ncbi:MAG: cation acetate symporter [Nocardioidaceae bacterium]|nr:cation acetate symporter [Nocardioidaceae bacterium]MCL2612540.1 cation acetate symporter [Nocardioidaceae bacterium]